MVQHAEARKERKQCHQVTALLNQQLPQRESSRCLLVLRNDSLEHRCLLDTEAQKQPRNGECATDEEWPSPSATIERFSAHRPVGQNRHGGADESERRGSGEYGEIERPSSGWCVFDGKGCGTGEFATGRETLDQSAG